MAENITLIAKVGTPTITDKVTTVGRDQVVTTSKAVTSGKWYWEVSLDIMSSSYPYAWLGVTSSTVTSRSTEHLIFNVNNYTSQRVIILKDNVTVETLPIFIPQGSVVGMVLDADNKTIQLFYGKDKYTPKYNISHLTDYTPAVLNVNANVSNVYTFNFGDSNFNLLDSVAQNITSEYKDKVFSYNGGEHVNPLNKILLLQSNGDTVTLAKGEPILENAIPVMTSNTTPSGIVTSETSHATSSPWRAFDKVDTQGYISGNGVTTGWIAYEFDSSVEIYKYTIRSGNSTGTQLNAMPKNFTFEGSNDGQTWDILDTQVNQSWSTINTDRDFIIPNSGIYKSYRLKWTANNGYASYSNLNELKMYALTNDKMLQLPNHNVNNFSKYGLNSPVKVDSKFTNKNYILQDTVSENAEGLWTTRINRKPLSIKFN